MSDLLKYNQAAAAFRQLLFLILDSSQDPVDKGGENAQIIYNNSGAPVVSDNTLIHLADGMHSLQLSYAEIEDLPENTIISGYFKDVDTVVSPSLNAFQIVEKTVLDLYTDGVDVTSVNGIPTSASVTIGLILDKVTLTAPRLITVYRDDVTPIEINVAGTGWNFTGKFIKVTAKENIDDPNGSAIIEADAVILTSTSARYTPSGTDLSTPGKYEFEWRQYDDAGYTTNPRTIMRVKLSIRKDVRQQ